jgi:hypothetical protein
MVQWRTDLNLVTTIDIPCVWIVVTIPMTSASPTVLSGIHTQHVMNDGVASGVPLAPIKLGQALCVSACVRQPQRVRIPYTLATTIRVLRKFNLWYSKAMR